MYKQCSVPQDNTVSETNQVLWLMQHYVSFDFYAKIIRNNDNLYGYGAKYHECIIT